MDSLYSDDIKKERLKKLAILKEQGMDPYPSTSLRTHTNASFLEGFGAFEKNNTEVTLAGRIMSLRGQGGIIFADLFDGTKRVQTLIKKDSLDENLFSLFEETVGVGDFIEVSGSAFTTKRGVSSLLSLSWRMLTKSVSQIPDEWFGIKDEDARYRKRYLDMLLNDEVRELVVKRSVFWNAVRSFMRERGFLEVETPVLESTTGGADAEPFKTHHNALAMDVYLRISAGELWQKRLLIAGFPKTFEIGRIFRNEGMSHEHLQDYTQMEFYMAYADFKDGMKMVQELYREVAQKTFGTLEFEIGGQSVDLGAEWKEYSYPRIVKEKTGIDIFNTNEEELKKKLDELSVEYDTKGFNVERGIDALWKFCRKDITGPGFLVDIPTLLSPLAKRDPKNEKISERFQPLIAGSELGNGYSELNDPLEQKRRFEEQQALRDAGDKEAQMEDKTFVEALEYGMPPACGFGMSERLFSFLANVSIREAQLFPLMKKREHE